jgi:hypothetical protein
MRMLGKGERVDEKPHPSLLQPMPERGWKPALGPVRNDPALAALGLRGARREEQKSGQKRARRKRMKEAQ